MIPPLELEGSPSFLQRADALLPLRGDEVKLVGVREEVQILLEFRQGTTMPQETFADFWPQYVLAHQHTATRVFHCVGTLSGWTILIISVVMRKPWWIIAAIVVPYALAWVSHFFVEHNRPASFGHPLWSWLADQRMVALILTGRMGREVRRCRSLT
jgi:hypothetical protein